MKCNNGSRKFRSRGSRRTFADSLGHRICQRATAVLRLDRREVARRVRGSFPFRSVYRSVLLCGTRVGRREGAQIRASGVTQPLA